MATDPTLGWTLLAEGTAQAEVQVNELLARLLAGIFTVKSKGDETPPGSPVNFDAYLLGTTPTGDWNGEGGNIAVYIDGWIFVTPTEGMRLRVADVDTLIDYDGSNWSARHGHQTLVESGGTIPWDTADGNSARIILDGNHTIDAPSNVVEGEVYKLRITQDGTGSRVPTWNAVFKFADGIAPTLTTTASAQDLLIFIGSGATNLVHIGTTLNYS